MTVGFLLCSSLLRNKLVVWLVELSGSLIAVETEKTFAKTGNFYFTLTSLKCPLTFLFQYKFTTKQLLH